MVEWYECHADGHEQQRAGGWQEDAFEQMRSHGSLLAGENLHGLLIGMIRRPYHRAAGDIGKAQFTGNLCESIKLGRLNIAFH